MNKKIKVLDIAYSMKDNYLNNSRIHFKKHKTYIVFEDYNHPSIKSELGDVFSFYFHTNEVYFKNVTNLRHLIIEKF